MAMAICMYCGERPDPSQLSAHLGAVCVTTPATDSTSAGATVPTEIEKKEGNMFKKGDRAIITSLNSCSFPEHYLVGQTVELANEAVSGDVRVLIKCGVDTDDCHVIKAGDLEPLRVPGTFKKGDSVRRKHDGKVDTVTGAPGEPEYDSNRFGDAAKGITLAKAKWAYSDQYELLEPAETEEKIEGEKKLPKTTTKNTTGSRGSAFETFLTDIQSETEIAIAAAVETKTQEIDEKLAEITGIAKQGATLQVKIGEATNAVTGQRHKQFEHLVKIAVQRIPVLMVGMAGTGKTHAAEQVAEGLGLNFYAMSVGAQTSKSDIIGYMHATGGYVRTLFREAFENGGVFLMDEIDAGNANVLIQVNAALSNAYCAFPDGMVKRHKDFVFIASANTFGNGANRQYVGRNQLDAATLDRFALLNWEIDEALEKSLAGTEVNGKKWFNVVQKIRAAVEKEGMRVLITPRATLRGALLLASGMTKDEVAELTIINSFPADKQVWAKAQVASAWSAA